MLIFSLKSRMESIVVATMPIPDHVAYTTFNFKLINDLDIKKKQDKYEIKHTIVGMSLENPLEYFRLVAPINSVIIAPAKKYIP